MLRKEFGMNKLVVVDGHDRDAQHPRGDHLGSRTMVDRHGGPDMAAVPGKPQRPDDRGRRPGEKEVWRAVSADNHVMQAVGAGNLLHLPKTPGGKLHVITRLFEPPDDRREEVSVGRVIQIDPDAHGASRKS